MSDLIERPWRCDIIGNPVGTDTRMIGAPPCDCQGCRAADRIAALEAEASEGERLRALLADIHRTSPKPFRLDRPGLTHGQAAEIGYGALRDAIQTRVAVALIPEAPAREGWQPIKTAPKDRAILVYDTGQGRCIAYWTQWHDNLLGEDREGWRTMGDWERLDWVTHWMAIPGPPPPQDREPDSQKGAK